MLSITCLMGMDSYHVLAKCVLLDNIETNSGLETMTYVSSYPVACKGK